MVHIFQCILLRTVRRKLTNLDDVHSSEANQLVEWLIKNVGPEVLVLSDTWYRAGYNWKLYLDGDVIKENIYVKFDARTVNRAQMTWFRLRWATWCKKNNV